MDDLRELANSSPKSIKIIHYACSSLGKNGKISCICVLDFDTRTTTGTYLADKSEGDMLKEFLEDLKKETMTIFVAWNMKNDIYGLQQIYNRCKELLQINEFPVDEKKVIDLDFVFAQEFGTNYCNHEKLPTIAQFNGLQTKDFIKFDEECKLSEQKKFDSIHLSVNRKVRIIAELLSLYSKNILKIPNKSKPSKKRFLDNQRFGVLLGIIGVGITIAFFLITWFFPSHVK